MHVLKGSWMHSAAALKDLSCGAGRVKQGWVGVGGRGVLGPSLSNQTSCRDTQRRIAVQGGAGGPIPRGGCTLTLSNANDLVGEPGGRDERLELSQGIARPHRSRSGHFAVTPASGWKCFQTRLLSRCIPGMRPPFCPFYCNQGHWWGPQGDA